VVEDANSFKLIKTIYCSLTVESFGKTREDPDGLESFGHAAILLGVVTSVFFCPTIIYFFYFVDAMIIKNFVSIFHALYPVPVADGLAILTALFYFQVLVTMCCVVPVPFGMMVMSEFMSLTSWMSLLTEQWYVDRKIALRYNCTLCGSLCM